MKSRLSFLFSLCMISMFFISCQKDESLLNDGQLGNRDDPAFTYSVNPANVGDSVVVTFNTGNNADCGLVQIQVSGPDGHGWQNGGKPVQPDSGIATLLFIPDAPGEYNVRAKYTRTGKPSACPFESTGWVEAEDLLTVAGDTIVPDTTVGDTTGTCEASFTGEAISCDSTREVVFVYTSDTDRQYIKIQGGLTNFTTEDAIVTVAGADLDITQRTPGNSSNRIITLEGSAEACVPITITITWNSTSNGAVITGDWSAPGGLTVEGLSCE